jgi:hypothetical protein
MLNRVVQKPFDLKGAASELGVLPETLRAWLVRGRARGAQPGGPRGRWFISPEEVDRLRGRVADEQA